MTDQIAPSASKSPAARAIPWLAAVAALVVFGLTLNHWISFLNMPEVVKASGLSWQSEIYSPAYRILTWPLHFLPSKWIPLAMNFFSAICGAAVLGLLARSVMLLPHDRTNDQRERVKSEHALLPVKIVWLPVLLAVAACGLQLTFWEQSINATPEMFNLLMLAYVIRCLLEYRVDNRDSWLYRAAFVYGAAMPNDWLVVLLSPGFVIAIIWMRGVSFFNLRFLGRMALFGTLGLSLYLVLPAIASASKTDPIRFLDALKANLYWQKYIITSFPMKMLLLMALYSIVPVIVLSIRWAASFGDNSPLGVAIATAVFHLVHLALLLVCLWVFFDPAFSPRNKNFEAFTFLFLYYLAALAVGYFSAYFLVVFRDVAARGRRPKALHRFLNKVAVALVAILAVGAPVGLIIKNLPAIRVSTLGLLRDYSEFVVANLPKNGVVLSDDPRHSALVRAWLNREGHGGDFVVVDTYALGSPGYHEYARRQYGDKWPVKPGDFKGEVYDTSATLQMIQRFAAKAELYYLEPSFGAFFEYFYLEPHGVVYRLKKYEDQALFHEPLSPDLIEANVKIWTDAQQNIFAPILAALYPENSPTNTTVREWIIQKLHLVEPRLEEARGAGAFYSRPLNYWGAQLQKSGDYERSPAHFELAEKLNPRNVVAKINLEFNKTYRSGEPIVVAEPKSVEEFFGEEARSWNAVLGAYGPFDEPNLCYALGREFYVKQLFRQSAEQFRRVRTFAPNDVASGLWLAQLNLLANNAPRAVEISREIIQQSDRFHPTQSEHNEAVGLLGRALFRNNAADEAERLLENAVATHTNDWHLLGVVTAVYSENARYSNALVNINRQLVVRPNDPESLLNKGFAEINLHECKAAIETMTQLLTIKTNSPDALLNRAIAYLHCGDLEKSQQDYERLLQEYPNVRQIYFGLQEIAYRQSDTNAAIQYCESYLSNAVPGATETKFVEDRLRELKGAAPTPDKKTEP